MLYCKVGKAHEFLKGTIPKSDRVKPYIHDDLSLKCSNCGGKIHEAHLRAGWCPLCGALFGGS